MARRSKTAWESLITGVVAVCLSLAALTLAFYFFRFHGPLSSESEKWQEFGEYFGGVLGPALSTVALLVVAYTSVRVPQELEEQRAATERVKTLLGLSQMLYDRQFYIYIVAPVWEIRLKWTRWAGPRGEDFKAQVIASYFVELGTTFNSPEQARELPYLNKIRFDNHFMPADWQQDSSAVPRDSHAFNQLSEHQALTIWIRFWCNIATLLEERLIEEEHVRNMFSDFYSWWLDLMLQLRLTGLEVFEQMAKTNKNRLKSLPRWCEQLKNLEAVLYVGEERSKTYALAYATATSSEAKELASRIAQAIASQA